MYYKILFATLIAVTTTILTISNSFAYSNECIVDKGEDFISCYDANGHQTSTRFYSGDPEDSSSTVTSAHIYTYDASGNQILEKEYIGDPDNDGTVRRGGVSVYDNNHHRVSYKEYTGDPSNGGTLTNTFISMYNEEGNKIAYIQYNMNSNNEEYVRYVETDMVYIDGDLRSKTEYSVENGRILKTNFTCRNGGCSGRGSYLTEEEWQTIQSSLNQEAQTYITKFMNKGSGSKRLYYTIPEAMEHVNHTNNNKITFTFK